MECIHVKNLEKYHPGYKDRELKWAKIYFQMVQGDPDCELIENEIDWCRLVKFILLELQAKKPIPLNDKYLSKKGFNLKKRAISLTLNMLQNFVEVVTEDSKLCSLEEEEEKEKEKEEEEDKAPANFLIDKKTPEGIMFRCWSRKCKNLEEQRLLQKAWVECGEEADALQYAFRQSVKYDKQSFGYVLKVIEGRNKEKLLREAKKREQKALLKKIQEAKDFKPDAKTVDVLKDVVASLKPSKKKKQIKPELSTEQKLERRRKEDEFKRAANEEN